MDETNRRKHPRVSLLDSHGTIRGEVSTLSNWSKEGALVSGVSGDFAVGDIFDMKLEVNSTRGYLSLMVKAEVMRVEGDSIGVRWWMEADSSEIDLSKLIDFFLSSEATSAQGEAADD